MKVIVIQDHDARALLDQLKLETMDANHRDYPAIEMEVRKVLEANLGPLFEKMVAVETSGAVASLLSDPAGEIAKQIHRRFHFVVTRWLQEQGASLLR